MIMLYHTVASTGQKERILILITHPLYIFIFYYNALAYSGLYWPKGEIFDINNTSTI